MGFVSEVINGLDKSKENYDELKESLDLLVSLVGAKASGFESEIEDMLKLGKVESESSLYLPITHVQQKMVQYRCSSTNDVTTLLKDVTDTVISFFDEGTAENIIKGVSNMVISALKTLVGIAEGSEDFVKIHAVAIDGNPSALSIVRTDYVIWSRRLSSKALKEVMTSSYSCVAYKSVVDVSKMKFDDFRSVYAKVLSSSGDTSVDEIIKMIEDAKKIFKVLGGEINDSPKWASRQLRADRPVNLITYSEPTPPGDKYFGIL